MKTTTGPESRESETQERVPAAQTGSNKPDVPPDPDFGIGVTGGPSDSGGDPNTDPVVPPKTK